MKENCFLKFIIYCPHIAPGGFLFYFHDLLHAVNQNKYKMVVRAMVIYERIKKKPVPLTEDCVIQASSAFTKPKFFPIYFPADKCCKEKDEGFGHFFVMRFYHEKRQCKPFLYRGMGGNENNFESLQQCLNACGAAAC